MISIIVIFYAAGFLVTNSLLIYASIKPDWRFTLPWLVSESLGCLSKLGALIYHLVADPKNLSSLFVSGSVLYVGVMIWWWFAVYSALIKWRHTKPTDSNNLSNLDLSAVSFGAPRSNFGRILTMENETPMASPGPYKPNNLYSSI